jgi:hypothetical protein
MVESQPLADISLFGAVGWRTEGLLACSGTDQGSPSPELVAGHSRSIKKTWEKQRL